MNIFKSFKFFYDLTERKLLAVVALAMMSSGFQGVALAALATVSEQDSAVESRNIVAKAIYQVIGWLRMSNDRHVFAMLLVIVAVSFSAMSLFLIFTNIYIIKLQNYVYIKIQRQAMEKLMNARYEYFASCSIGHFNNVIISQLRTVAVSFKYFTTIIVLVLSALPFMVISFAMNTRMAVSLCLILSLLIPPIRWINRKTREYSILNVEEMSKLNSIMIQILSHYKYLKATCNYKAVSPRLFNVVANVALIAKKLVILGSGTNHGITPLIIALICGLVYWQVALMGVPIVSAGVVLGLLYMASTRLNAVPVAYQKFVSASGAIVIYQKTIEQLESEREKLSRVSSVKADFSGTLLFNNVSFRYRSKESDAVENLSFEIPPRSSIAFVGGSGSGKSTIVNMIAGLLAPRRGGISLSGTGYEEIDLESLREGIGYVTQEPVIFTDTVANNISLWNPDYDMLRTQNAARAAHAHDFIMDLPDAYDTMLGDHGVNISGGQRQRISIAREFVRATPLLILDEATSSLDSETEQSIQQSIEELKGAKTLVIIAHRLSTIRNCDKIIVLDEGKIVGIGSYNELFQNNHIFRKMVERQSL